MDTDFVITGPLHPYLDQLNDHDIISYSDHGVTSDTACDGQFILSRVACCFLVVGLVVGCRFVLLVCWWVGVGVSLAPW